MPDRFTGSARPAENAARAEQKILTQPLIDCLGRLHRARQSGSCHAGRDMHGIEGFAAALHIKADGIDGAVSAEEGCSHRSLVMDISSRRLRRRVRSGCRSNPLGVARCRPHPEAVVKQMTDDPATEKPGSAENCDEPAMAGWAVCKVFCHDAQACLPGRFGLSSQGGKAAPQHAAAFLLVNEQPGRLRDGYRASS